MFCKKCGKELADGSKFCTNCGADLTETDNNNGGSQQTYTGTVHNGASNTGIQNRSIAVCILLSIITCGIYSWFWLYSMVNDLNTASNETDAQSGGIVLLLSIVTCGIYGWYWMYKAGGQVIAAKEARGMTADTNLPILYLILGIFGLSIISYCLIQDELNKISA